MSMNPLKYLGGLVLEIGAVVAALAFIPALGGSPAPIQYLQPASAPSLSGPISTNQVYFDAQSTRVLDPAALARQPANPPQRARTAWQNDFAPLPSPAEQRYVEQMLDHNSQRAMDTALRVLNRGDELLPTDLRMRREEAPPSQLQLQPRQPLPMQTQHDFQPRAGQPQSYYAPRRLADDRY